METKPLKFIVDVAPIARLPLSKQQFYSYLSETQLPQGTMVMIPLFNRETEGIVLACKPETEKVGDYKLKSVTKVLALNFLNAKQLLLAQQLSEYYLNSLGVVLKHFMPKRVNARNSSHQSLVISHRKPNITLTPEQNIAVSAIADNHSKFKIQNSKFLLFGPASSGKTEVYIHAILELRKKNPQQQFLILLPELTLTPQALARYGAYFNPREIVLLHSKLGKGEFYALWQRIASGEAKIIISTRIGIFAPFQELGGIFVDEEQDMSFKQWDMNPRYDARLSAELLAQNHQAKIVFGTATPRIESFQKTTSGEFSLLKIPTLPAEIMGREKTVPGIEIVDMRKEKWTDFAGKKQPNHSLLSMRLQEEISYAISQNLQTILFVNHQGMNTFSVCAACKAVLKCPKCDRAVVLEQTGGYKCLHCNFKADATSSCKACGSIAFTNIGIGTQLVEREVKKLFGKVRVTRLDSTAAKKPGASKEIFDNFMQGNIDVLIGTQMITKGWDNPMVGLVGVIDSDSLFSSPDYLTDERAYANIMQIAGRTGRVGSRYVGHVLIQTFNPQRPVFDFVTSRNYPGFYAKEIAQRQALHYPPFGKIIKLSCKDADKNKITKDAQIIYEKISAALKTEKNISLTEPSEPLVSKVRGKFILQMILKIKTGSEINSLPASMIKILGSLSSSWAVDVDPISIA
ncbi:MAG: primosomal protein N' [Candidatus Moranbacteria bacterium]|nr:primosomal protein N' [Candidatus Moranbacteria bacterium]